MKRIQRILILLLVLALLLSDSSVAKAATGNVLTLPSDLQVVEEEAFYGSDSVDRVVLPEGVTEIYARAFAQSTLSQINLPDSLTFIDDSAFDGPDKVTVSANPGSYSYQWAVDHGYIRDDTLRVTVSCSAENAVPGDTVTWTAEGVNGVEPYKYRFQLFRDGTRIATRAYGAGESYSYEFSQAGAYYVLVQLKDDNGEIVEVRSEELVVSLEQLTIVSVTCNKESLQTTDTAMWTASAIGGEPPYRYCYTLKQNGQSVDTMDYSLSDSYSYTFANEGTYTLEVTVKDSQDSVSALFTLPVEVALRPVEILGITADAESAETESSITWTVEAAAGKEPYTYDYEIKLDGISQCVETGAPQNTFTFQTETAGSCVLTVTVTDAAGNIAALDSRAIEITTKELSIISVNVDNDWVMVGNEIRWRVEAVGGVKPLRYAFDVYADGEEIDGRAFREDSSFVYTPEESGEYTAEARVRDASLTTVRKESPVVHVYDPIEVLTLTADRSEALTGEPVVWTAEVNGGKGSLTYSWMIYWGDVLEFTCSTEENSVSWAPMRAGTYDVVVTATDEDGSAAQLRGGAVTTSVHPATPVEDFSFKVLNGTYCELTGYSGDDVALILPDEDGDGHIVQNIASSAFSNRSGIYSVLLPNSVETIGSSAFSGCEHLLRITCGEKLVRINDSAFSGCYSLASVTLPEGLEVIESYAFSNCVSLESIHLPDSVTTMYSAVFAGCSKLREVNYPASWAQKVNASNYVRSSPFDNCPSLTGIEIPEGVTFIPAEAFTGVISLRNVSIPASVTSIGDGAFSDCSGLRDIDLSGVEAFGGSAFIRCTGLRTADLSGAVSIGYSAFGNCTGLVSVMLPDYATEDDPYPAQGLAIGSYAFSGCAGLTGIVLPYCSMGSDVFANCTSLTSATVNKRTSLPGSTFSGCSKLESVTLPEGLEVIESYAFSNCVSLESIHLPDSVTTMYSAVFAGCSKLREVNYPASWAQKVNASNYVRSSPFDNCPSLTSIEIPDGVTFIPAEAFTGVISLRNVSIPASVTSIGDGAFSDCSGLRDIDLSGVEAFGGSAFIRCTGLRTVDLRGAVSIGSSAFQECTGLVSVMLPDYATEDDPYPAQGLAIGSYAFSGCAGLTGIVLPYCSMGGDVFANCTALTSATVNKRTSLPGSTFSGCSKLESVTLPEGLEVIEPYAFSNCTSLESIHLPDSVTTMYSAVFAGCSKLLEVNYPASWVQKVNASNYVRSSPFDNCPSLTSIEIPDGVTFIPAEAFTGVISLRSVSIPASVTSIGDNAFYGHDAQLVFYVEADSYAESYAEENSILHSTSPMP